MSGDTLKIIYKQFVIHVLADVITFVYEVPFIFLHYINVDGVSWITLKKYYKVRWNYYKLRQVLQSGMDLLQIATGITKCDDYYKLRQYRCIKRFTANKREKNCEKLSKIFKAKVFTSSV